MRTDHFSKTRRRVVYASGWSNPIAGQRTYSAYAIQDDFTPRLLNTVPACGTKPIANQFIPQFGRHGVFYGVDFVNPCGDVWTVKENGAFDEKIEAINFEQGATLHGFTNTPDLRYTYITVRLIVLATELAYTVQDLGGNRIHTYSVNRHNGSLTEIAQTAPSVSGAGPRHATMHPKAKFMYVIDEEGLRVDQFSVNASTGAIALTNVSLPVTPFGM
jgi:carboxy-cis,cis-muconate cyclase